MRQEDMDRIITESASEAGTQRQCTSTPLGFPLQLLESLASRSQDLVLIIDAATGTLEYCNLNSVMEQAQQPYYQHMFQQILDFSDERDVSHWTIADGAEVGGQFSVLSYRVYCADILKYVHIINGNLRWESSQNHDSATGLFTRAFCLDRMQEMIAASIRFTVCYLDMDNLRVVNEQYGLQAGDHYIADVVRMLGNSIRREDLFARVGSDEFIILFKSCTEEAIMKKMEAITKSLRRNAPQTDRAERGLSYCTVRIAGPSAITVDQILELCNRRMYERRRFGKI